MDHVNISRHEASVRPPLTAIFIIVTFVGAMLMGQLVPELQGVRAIIVTPIILFLPGLLALKALGIRLKNFAEVVVMALGLSIALVMLLGLCANFVLPLVGIADPLSIVPLTVLLSALLAVLIVAASRDGSLMLHLPQFAGRIRPYHLFLVLVPLVTLLGVAMQNYFSSNLGLIASLLLVCLTVVLVGLGKIPKEAYALTIFVVGLSLLLHTSLISDFLWGWDINKEYYSASYVIDTGVWSPDRYSNVNTMLSIVVLGPVISILSGASIEMVLRVVYPFIFAFVPVGLYVLYAKQTNEGIAFYSSLLIISVYMFFQELPQLARQEVAELFVVLLLWLLIDVETKELTKTGLFILFAFSLIVSHYATYYFFIAVVLLGYILGLVLQKWRFADRHVASHFPKLREPADRRTLRLSPGLLLLIIFFSLAWYTFPSFSAPLVSVIDILTQMLEAVVNGISGGSTLPSLGGVGGSADTLLHEVWKISQLAFAAAILLGAYLVLKGRRNHYDRNFAAVNIVALLVLAGCMALPYLASSLNSSRLYHLALLFLAPSAIIGVIVLLEKVGQLARPLSSLGRHSMKIVSAVIVISIVFNTGLLFEVTGDKSTSFALDRDFDFPRFTSGEVAAVEWTVRADPAWIATDSYRSNLFYSFTTVPPLIIPTADEQIPYGSIVYFGTYNLDHRELNVGSSHISWRDAGVYQLQSNSSKIYASEFSEVYYINSGALRPA